ncbi:MAG: GNAT family N-acetyltransferase [Candidatus Omnitrophica bacterium]|nr:GNAT family N-acetyltransferase [Candidatus Omnitrophota bacterium]
MNVRPFRKGDEDAVRQLITTILDEEFFLEKKAYSETDLDMISEVYSGNRNIFLVGEVDYRIVGTAAVKEDDRDTALLRRLFVDPAHRGKKYGSQLVDQALAFCKQKGYKKVIFRGTVGMAAAMGLIRRKGFSEVEKLRFGEVEMIHFSLSL